MPYKTKAPAARHLQPGRPAADNRPWTPADDARLRDLFAEGKSRAEIAKALGRSFSAVDSREYKLRRSPGRGATVRDRLRRLHAAGKTRAEICATLRLGETKCQRLHRELGLVTNRPPAAVVCRKINAVVLARYGTYAVQLPRIAEAVASFAAGWPDVPAGARAQLEVYESRGPASVSAHAARIGAKMSTTHRAVHRLVDAGHLVVVGAQRNKFCTKPILIYDLDPKIRRHRRWLLRLRGVPEDELPPAPPGLYPAAAGGGRAPATPEPS